MADQKSDNGGKGAPVPPGGKGPGVFAKWLKEQIQNLKGRVKEEGESLKRPEKTQLFKSMFRVFLTGSYKKPREFNWCVGVVLLVLTLLLSFTGYLLPDDQLGFWAVTVGTTMAQNTPLLGSLGPLGRQLHITPYNDVRFALLGGSIVDANALLRAYIWHCIAIPIIASVFMGVHFWRVRKDGGISGPAPVMLASDMDKPVPPYNPPKM